jgi:glycine C-acetyltransferase/8-amino-7-oxononanoate synthase
MSRKATVKGGRTPLDSLSSADRRQARADLQQRLDDLAERGLDRRMRPIEGPQGPEVLLDGRPVLLLCSNDYLGLATHPQVREAAAQAALSLGAGSGASRLVSGTMSVHTDLEQRLAEFEGTQACVLFGSGYLANMGVIGALAGRGDVVFSDELNHASILDGCRLSRAQVVVYRHCDLGHLETALREHRGSEHRRLIVTDSVFSMDGEIAPLPELLELARRHGARLVVDEAHATGALGPGGRGAVAAAGLQGEVDAVVGTLSKALGSYGAYVCGKEQTIDYLVNVARPLIFSTAPPPPAIAAAAAALELICSRPTLIDDLHAAARTLRRSLLAEGFAIEPGEMHIVPLVACEQRAAVALCEAAIERGVFAQAIRPPTVPLGSSRLRLTAMATHTPEQMQTAARTLRESALAVGLDPALLGERAHGRLLTSAGRG